MNIKFKADEKKVIENSIKRHNNALYALILLNVLFVDVI